MNLKLLFDKYPDLHFTEEARKQLNETAIEITNMLEEILESTCNNKTSDSSK